jgi:Abortive infection C-terminus
MNGMPKIFSRRTLDKFEDASASIVLRQIDRAFQGAGIRLGDDPGGPDGDRRTQFRRYVASVNQQDPQQLDRLGDALGALIEAAAASKGDFLIKAAESDGFSFVNGAFRPAKTSPSSFAVTRGEDLAFIDDRGRRLHLLASESPKDAIVGAQELIESVCRTILRLSGERGPGKTTELVDIAKSTLKTLELIPIGIDEAKNGSALVRRCLQELGAVVDSLNELRKFYGSSRGRAGKWKALSPRHARLAAAAAVAFSGFVAETYVEQAALKNG